MVYKVYAQFSKISNYKKCNNEKGWVLEFWTDFTRNTINGKSN